MEPDCRGSQGQTSEFLGALNPPSVTVFPNSELGGPREDAFSESCVVAWQACFHVCLAELSVHGEDGWAIRRVGNECSGSCSLSPQAFLAQLEEDKIISIHMVKNRFWCKQLYP